MICVVIVTLLSPAVAPPVQTSPRSLVIGVLHADNLFLTEPKNPTQPFGDGLYTHRLVLPRPSRIVKYWLPAFYHTEPVRWRIAYGCLWVCTFRVGLEENFWRIPLADLDVLDVTRPPELYGDRFPGGTQGQNYHHERFIAPLFDFTQRYIRTHPDRVGLLRYQLIPGAYSDVLPADQDGLLYFLLYRGRLQMWQGERPWLDLSRMEWDYHWSRRPVAEWKTSLAEPFIPLPGTNRYWFLTVSGKVYAAATDGRKGAALAAVWAEPKRPVRAALTDTASGKTFLFGGGEPGGGPGFCLELKADARPIPFPAAVKAGETSLRRLERYARELADRQHIRLNAARPADRKP